MTFAQYRYMIISKTVDMNFLCVCRSSLARESGTPKLLHPRIEGFGELPMSDSIKQEIDDHGEGVQMSPGKRKRKQVNFFFGLLYECFLYL